LRCFDPEITFHHRRFHTLRVDQLLSITNSLEFTGSALFDWRYAGEHYLVLTIRDAANRPDCFYHARIFILLTIVMAIGYSLPKRGVWRLYLYDPVETTSLAQRLYHMLTASMKGLSH